jgi:hypothetical protein
VTKYVEIQVSNENNKAVPSAGIHLLVDRDAKIAASHLGEDPKATEI